MVLLPQGLLPHWPADYRSDAVELYRKYEAGVITKAEMELRLGAKYPGYDIPDKRTLRRWAHEKYRDLPERRRRFLKAQAVDERCVQQHVLAAPLLYSSLPHWTPAPSMPSQIKIEELFQPVINFAVALTMMRLAVSVGNYVGKSLNEMLNDST